MRLTKDQLTGFIYPVMADRIQEKVAFINKEFLIKSWENLMDQGSGVAYGVMNEAGEPGGFLLGIHALDPLTGKKTAYEFLWIVPLHEKVMGAAFKLIREFEAGAKADDCVESVIGCFEVCEPVKLRRSYHLLGYKDLSQSFSKKL